MWDAYREHAEHEFGARYDDVRERYHAERLDMEAYEASEREHDEYMWKVEQAGFGDDWQAYETHFRQLDQDIEEWEMSK